MATDLERLVVGLSADIKSYENAMAKATGITRTQLKLIKAEAEQAGVVSGAAFDGASRGVQRFGAGAQKARAQVVDLRGQTGNLAAQFQDIAVQLQSGTSPFTIALQQGTQISAALGGAGARGAVAALGAAFTSVISPVSLATIAIIAAGGAAVQYFSTLSDDGAKSAEELKAQADMIRRVAEEWGEAVPALQEYAAELERVRAAEELREAGAAAIEDIWSEPKEQVKQYAAEVEKLAFLLQIGRPDEIDALRDAFRELQDNIEDETASAEDAQAVLDILNRLMASGGEIAQNFAAGMSSLAGSLDMAANSAARVTSEVNSAVNAMRQFRAAEAESMRNLAATEQNTESFIKNQERLNSLTADQLALENERQRIQGDVERVGGAVSPDTALRLAEQTLAAEQRRADIAEAERKAAAEAAKAARKSSGARDKAAAEAEREREAVLKLIEQLQFEHSLIGLTDLEREKANALRRAGAAATAEQRAQIEALVTASYQEVQALEDNEEQLERIKNLSKDVLGGIFEDLRDGASAADILANALNRVAESLIKAGIDKFVDDGGGGLFGGILGNIFGSRSTPGQIAVKPFLYHRGGIAGVDGYGHGRSVPAAMFANAKRYHSGGTVLMPGEVPAILQRGETVLPRGAGATVVELRMSPDVEARVLRRAEGSSIRITQAGMRQVRRDVPGIVLDAQRRGG